MRCSRHHFSRESTRVSQAHGSQKFTVPTSMALAPASMNSITSSAVLMPPIPMTGIFTALAASHTMRRAIGLMAGPDSPAVTLETVSYTHLRAHETRHDLVCRLLLEKKKKN